MIGFDPYIHIVEAVAIVFWIGVTWGDVKWIKAELRHLRGIVEASLMKGRD